MIFLKARNEKHTQVGHMNNIYAKLTIEKKDKELIIIINGLPNTEE